jgi:predicted regulator of Ras-like GTPase activity (Roadblock/LC7/MglB family)
MQKITKALAQLKRHPDVETAVLATGDGLSLDATLPASGNTAAVAGFMMAATRQSTAMLGIDQIKTLTMHLPNGTFIIYYPFVAADHQLILTVIFKRSTRHKRLLSDVVKKITEIMES